MFSSHTNTQVSIVMPNFTGYRWECRYIWDPNWRRGPGPGFVCAEENSPFEYTRSQLVIKTCNKEMKIKVWSKKLPELKLRKHF